MSMFGVELNPQQRLLVDFNANKCIDDLKHYLDHFPMLHPCCSLRSAVDTLKLMPADAFLGVFKASLDYLTRVSKRTPNAPQLTADEWAQFRKIALDYVGKNREAFLDASSTALFLATAKPGDKIRQSHFSPWNGKDVECKQLLDEELITQMGGDPREVNLTKYVFAFYPLATLKNYSGLSHLLCLLLTHVLEAGYPGARDVPPHPEHGGEGNFCRRGIVDDVNHWSVRMAHCGNCGTHSDRLLYCSRCHNSAYCSGECQRAHWPKHKPTCKAAEIFPKPVAK